MKSPCLDERKALIDSLEVGDLIRLNGTLRVVRGIGVAPRKGKPCRVYSVTFAIRRCSWTRRAYTTRNRFDLYRADFEVVSRGFGVDHGPLDAMIQQDITQRLNGRGLLECCDVIGVIA